MAKLFKFIFILLLLSVTSYSYGWNAMGHRVIAQIAYDHLQPKAKQQVNQLIDFLANEYPYNSTFQTAAVWADSLRQDDVNTFNQWHFINLPFSSDGTATIAETTPNILWAITQSENVLTSVHSNQFEKAFFLRFLIHLVGDAHQPLHCINYFSKNFPQGDGGGNLFTITNSSVGNLHALWDNGLGLFDIKACFFGKFKFRRTNCLVDQIEKIYPSSYFAAKAQDLNAQHWVQESFTLAQKIAYKIQLNTEPSPQYIQQTQTIASQQLALAGYRLANLLNQLYA